MTKLIIIRHGESEFNLTERYTGQLYVPLTETGVRQAKITADYILKNYKIDAVYSSDLSRAVETARPVAAPLGIEIKTDKGLREIYAGKWEGLYFTQVHEIYAEDYALYKKDSSVGRPTGGEYLCEVMARVDKSIRTIAEENDGKTVLISMHNGSIKALQMAILGFDRSNVMNLANNSITEIDFEDGIFKPIRLGFDEHLGNLSTTATEVTAN